MTALRVIQGDCREVLRTLEPESVQCCVTSPPYWGLRDYGNSAQIGLEPTPEAYVCEMVAVFREVWRVLRGDGTLWLNLGDSYQTTSGGGQQVAQTNTGAGLATKRSPSKQTGLKPKDLIGIPWRVALALQSDGWWLRQDIIWHKPNPMPESVTDRCTKAHEYLFLLTKAERYFYDAEAIKEPFTDYVEDRIRREASRGMNGQHSDKYRTVRADGGATTKQAGARFHMLDAGRNKRSVWTIPTSPYPESHFATFPPDLIKPCILAGTKAGDTVLDPFAGSGTTGMVALEMGRRAVLIELNPEYVKLAQDRCNVTPGLLL